MLIPGSHDTVMYQGVSWTFRVQWLVGEASEPVDLTGYTGALRVKTRKQADISLTELTTGNGRLTLDADGNIVGRLDKEVVNALPVGTLWYELELFSTDDSVQLLAGRVRVEP